MSTTQPTLIAQEGSAHTRHGASGPTATASPSGAVDPGVVQALWAASQDADDAPFRPTCGWWSLAAWATAAWLLRDAGGETVGVAAVEGKSGAVAEARLALRPGRRTAGHSDVLVRAALTLGRRLGATDLRLYAPAAAGWAVGAAARHGFALARAQHVMLLPAEMPTPALPTVEGVDIRSLADGEEGALLVALNRAWAGTWNFRPLTAEALGADLARGAFLLAVARSDGRIVGTVQPLAAPAATNPDGNPHAWVSNLTTDPAQRGRGLGRALLAAAIGRLRAGGARSVALGVDGGAVAPVALYRSAGFEVVATVELWERPLDAPART
jgi:GNAT superfamily N-acetyltransferase